MPVGMFSALAKTETVKPSGTRISPPFPGSKETVSAGQIGFATVAAIAMAPGSVVNLDPSLARADAPSLS